MMRGLVRAAAMALALFTIACFPRQTFAASCTVSALNIPFGSFSGTLINISGTITVKCTSGVSYNVGINAGTAAGATVTNRSMTGLGSALLGYALYSDSGHTTNWGNTSGTGWVTGTGNGGNQTITVFAQLPANEFAPAGLFTDATVTVSVSGTAFSTATNHFSVTATVVKACNITATSLNFGTYSTALINSTSTISVTCTSTTAYNVGLNAGTASGATVTTRKMAGPSAALLNYALYRNSAHTLNWGNTAGTDTVAGTGSGIAQSLTVYGQVPAGQYSGPGSYTDTITATLTY